MLISILSLKMLYLFISILEGKACSSDVDALEFENDTSFGSALEGSNDSDLIYMRKPRLDNVKEHINGT